MKRRPAPRLATWLLEHLADRYRREALVGDLAEEFRAGRSSGWYWRQVLLALAASARRVLWPRRPGVVVLIGWWSLFVMASVARMWPVLLILALDPSPYLLYRHHQRRHQSAGDRPCENRCAP